MPTQIDLGQVRVAADELDYNDLQNKPLLYVEKSPKKLIDTITFDNPMYVNMSPSYDIINYIQYNHSWQEGLTVYNPPFYIMVKGVDATDNTTELTYIRKVVEAQWSSQEGTLRILNTSNNIDLNENFEPLSVSPAAADTLEFHFYPNDYAIPRNGLAVIPKEITIVEPISRYIPNDDIGEYALWDKLDVSDKMATKNYVDNEIGKRLVTVYKLQGSTIFENLPQPALWNRGYVYNITNEFTTTNDFVEGSGKTYPAGSNVVIIQLNDDTLKFDVLGGWIDLSTKQDALVSGTNIKTINNQSILGSGNIDISVEDENVFVVTYGETTYEEVDAAYKANKSFVLIDKGLFQTGTGETFFCSVMPINQGQVSIYKFSALYVVATLKSWQVQSDDVWSRFNDTPLQKALYSGQNIKTINNQSLLGSGNIDIQSGTIAQATDSTLGTVKINSAQNITLDNDGKLVIGGRLGQFSSQETPAGGLYYPTNIEPTDVKASTLLMSDGAKNLSLAGRTFGIMAGINLTCKSAAAGATQYRLSNTQGNRFACFACKGGRLAIDQTDATENGTALMTDISFANGNPISAYFGPTESSNDIIITVDRTVNPSASTTKLRMYGTSTSGDVIIVGQGNGASGGKAISLGQACHAGGNQCIAFGNSSLSLANNSVALGHTNLVNKQFCFCAGQGHDFTNGSDGTSAVGIASEISSNTAFAVGNGTFNANSNIVRSNAFEVTKDGGIVLKSPNGTRYKISIDDSGNIAITAV